MSMRSINAPVDMYPFYQDSKCLRVDQYVVLSIKENYIISLKLIIWTQQVYHWV